MPDGPEIGENGLEQRLLEEVHPQRAARSVLRADGSFDEFDVPITPFFKATVDRRHLDRDGMWKT